MKNQKLCYYIPIFTLIFVWEVLSSEMMKKDTCPRCSTCSVETKVNKWSEPQIAESRQKNTPSPVAHVRAAVYVRYEETTPPEVRDRLERVLVFGGWETVDPYKSVVQPRGTWIYTPVENSWFRIPTKVQQPPDRFGHSLTTACRNTVVLYGGILTSDVSDGVDEWSFSGATLPPPVSELWVFDGIREEWDKQIIDDPPPPRYFHSAVAFASGVSTGDMTCSSQHSIIIFGGMTRDENSNSSKLLNDLWELQCVGLGGGESAYRWRRHDAQPFWPDGRFFHFSANFNNHTMLMFAGQLSEGNMTYATDPSLWSLNISSGSWKLKNYSKLEERHSKAEDPEWPTAVFVVDAIGNRILQIQAGGVYSFKQNPISWVQETVFIGSSTPVDLRDFAAVVVNGTVFVFAGIEPHTSFQSMRVWTVEMINGSWIWQLRSAPRTSPPLQALAFWNVVGDRLVFAASTPHEWGVFLCHRFAQFVDVIRQTAEPFQKADLAEQLRESVKALISEFKTLRIDLSAGSKSVWQMDIETRTWWQYSTATDNRPLFYTAREAISLNESKILISYGGSSVLEFEKLKSSSNPVMSPLSLAVDLSEVFLYFLGERRWIKPMPLNSQQRPPKPRVFPTLTHVGDGRSMILFGGAVVKTKSVEQLLNSSLFQTLITLSEMAERSMKNDVWKLTLSSNWQSLPPDQIRFEWTQLKHHSKLKNASKPDGRLGHKAFVIDNMLVIWGGLRLSSQQLVQCANELWILNLDDSLWTNHNPIASVSKCWNVKDLCRAPAALLGATIVTIHEDTNETSCNSPQFLSVLVNETNCHLRPHDHVRPFPFRPEFMFAWNDQVLALKQEVGNHFREKRSELTLSLKYQDRIYTSRMTPGCDSGTYSPEWGKDLCMACDSHCYAPPGAVNCTQCPKGLHTSNARSASRHDCICDPGYCHHGRCFIAHTRGEPSAECQCAFGFTGAQCQHATYFIIAGVSIASLVIFLLLLVFIRKMMKYKKQEAAKEMQLEEMSRVWTIKRSEIVLLHRIDDGAPGSYGDVYKARYRDMIVALKKLKLRTREFEREFDRETQLMKSMRHENIVLFLGAGTFGTDDCPFLVIEYMQNGALTNILGNKEITITREQETNFCLDAAKGMKFLHSQRPPRIHRDLKSSNLLVSARWVIKVADFGSARLVKSLGGRQSVVKRKTSATTIRDTAAEPLLKAEGALSDSVGSAFWRAPEIFAEEPYGTPVDVYSFGIVMWEIAARDRPYRNKGYRWVKDIKEAVLTGVRPTLPNGVSKSYRDLMSECWCCNPSRRPTFTEVVQRLARMPLQNYVERLTLVVGSAP